MVIRSRTIRLGIFISTFIIAAIIIFQLIWLRKVYHFEQKQFDHGIAQAIRGLYEDLDINLDSAYNLNQLIENPNSQTFILRTDSVLDRKPLAAYLQRELEGMNIFTDCYIGMYDAAKNGYDYTAFLPSATSYIRRANQLPVSRRDYNHLTLYFPHRSQYILSLMNFWIISSLVLLLVLIGFGGSLYYFYRQKFLNETQKDFVNNFTHEFKTPVSVINLAADVLARPDIVQKPEKLKKYASIVQYQGQYLQEQIERLLRYAYSESNLLHLHREKVDLHELVKESLDNLKPLLEQKNASVVCDLQAEDPQMQADKGYLLVVITNLVENAVKYSDQPKIIISTREDEGHIILSVKDNGRGIERRYRGKIFKKFYRVPNGEQVSGRGFGLGLAFVKRIVQSHRGRISVESISGVGSEFLVKLPLS